MHVCQYGDGVMFQILFSVFLLLLPLRVKEAETFSMSILQIMFREVVHMSKFRIIILAFLAFFVATVRGFCPFGGSSCRVPILGQGRWVATPENLRVLAETLLEVCMHMAPWLPWLP